MERQTNFEIVYIYHKILFHLTTYQNLCSIYRTLKCEFLYPQMNPMKGFDNCLASHLQELSLKVHSMRIIKGCIQN